MKSIWNSLVIALVASGLALSPMAAQQAQAKCAVGKGAGWGTLAGAVVFGFTGFFVGRNAGQAAEDSATGAAGGESSGLGATAGGAVGAVVGVFGGAIAGLVLGMIVGAIACSWGNDDAVEEGEETTEEEAWLRHDGQLYAISKSAVRSMQQESLVQVIDYQMEVIADNATMDHVDVSRRSFDRASIRSAFAGSNWALAAPDFGGELSLAR